jgi:predicted transglutaminase-like cysteine proteinase
MLMFVAPWVAAVSNYRYISDKALGVIERKYGAPASARIAKWSDVLNKFAVNKSISDAAMARFSNDYFNQVRWEWDIDHWGVEDYWATHIETLGTYAGVC